MQFSLRAALETLGVGGVTDEALSALLGAPLPKIFQALSPGISEPQVEAGIAAYRRAFDATGISMNVLYPGVPAMLEAIAGIGCASWIVTSKPQHFAERVASNLGIAGYFAGVVGAGLDEKDTKTGLVATALRGAKVDAAEAVMIGDRSYDVIGALENGVMPVGALWGYGSYREFYDSGCRHFAGSPAEFARDFVPLAQA